MRDVDDVSAAAIAVCATRLDSTVSAQEFVELVDKLIDASRRSATSDRAAAPPVSDGDDDADVDPDDPKPPGMASLAHGPSAGTRRREASGPQHDRAARLSFDDRTKLRREYQQAMDGRQRAPRGWLEGKAAAYGVHVSTIKSAVYGTDGA